MNELGSSSRKSQELPCNFYPVLMPFDFCQCGLRYIMIPNLRHRRSIKYYSGTIKHTFSLLCGHVTGVLYPGGSGTRHNGPWSGQCLSRCWKCDLLRNLAIAASLSKQAKSSFLDKCVNVLVVLAVLVASADGGDMVELEENIYTPRMHNAINTTPVAVGEKTEDPEDRLLPRFFTKGILHRLEYLKNVRTYSRNLRLANK
ncbi:hypothetical protein Leryth_002515 [Lithospermum erythrorhizon]|nr:hypothetical protein Leryth_002515 [Lithospermum erythrorhizon]